MSTQENDKSVYNRKLTVSSKLPVCVFRGLPRFEEGDYKKIHITKDMVKKVLDQVSDKDAEIIAQEVNRVAKKFHLDTELRLSHFFAQLKHESVGGKKAEENLNYTNNNKLQRKLEYRKHHDNFPQNVNYDFHKLKGKEKEIAVAEVLYWHKNGNIKLDDGYNYRGGGLIQLTGRYNYTDFNRWYHQNYNDHTDFVNNPREIEKTKYAIISAIYFWEKNKAYIPADKNDANGVSHIINKGDIGTFPRRKQYTDKNLHSRVFSDDKIKSFDTDLYQKNLQYILKRPDCAFSLPSPINTNFYSGFIDAEQDSSPLIIDLDGDGVKSIALNHSSIFFDLDNDGFAEKTAWVGPHDGLLVRDLNHNGIIDSGLLTASSSPKLWKELLIWQDRNSNGRTDQGELTPLSATGISLLT